MTLDIRIPISPTPSFFNRTRLLAASIRQFYPDAIVRAYIGCEAHEAAKWQVKARWHLPDIHVHFIPQPAFDMWAGTRSPHLATMNARFQNPWPGTHVIIADADILCIRPFPELFLEEQAIQGVQAHVAPLSNDDWMRLFRMCSAGYPVFAHAYSGEGIMGPIGRSAPWYVNSGMVFACRGSFHRICAHYPDVIEIMRRNMRDTYWFDQLALAVGAARAGGKKLVLQPRYNFPNQRGFDEAYPDDLADIRFLHYLRTDTIDRDRDFASLDAMLRLVDRTDLDGSNEVLRQRVEELLPLIQPEPLTSGEDAPWA